MTPQPFAADGSPGSVVTGRCYCGATRVAARTAPHVVAYCHCDDCRRVSGAPVAAYAAFRVEDVVLEPSEIKQVSVNTGVTRGFCPQCCAHVAGWYDYLPGQVFIAIGVLDHAADFAPTLHAHAGARLPWLDLRDDAARIERSSRSALTRRSE